MLEGVGGVIGPLVRIVCDFEDARGLSVWRGRGPLASLVEDVVSVSRPMSCLVLFVL